MNRSLRTVVRSSLLLVSLAAGCSHTAAAIPGRRVASLRDVAPAVEVEEAAVDEASWSQRLGPLPVQMPGPRGR
jgi:hypothetical protein